MSVIEELEAKIREANEAYWDNNAPTISDSEYDRLVEALRKLDPNNKLVNHIGKPVSDGRKIKLWEPHLSLNKVYSQQELINWIGKVARSPDEKLMVSPKYDGITCIQQCDELVGRGDGYEGQSITHLAQQIGIIYNFTWNDDAQQFIRTDHIATGILDHADDKETCTGELCINVSKFAELKAKYPEVFERYKNCRNFIAGFANSKSDSVIANLKNEKGYPVCIGDLVLHRAHEMEVSLKDLEDPRTFKRLETALRDFQGYPTDGLVFRLKDEQYAKSLGETAHHPRGAVALKWSAQQLPGKIKQIEWDVGNERLTPVAILEEPCKFDGHLVSRATLHCAQWLQEHHAGIGSKIIVEYAGGVIPKVVDVTYDEDVKVAVPDKCPYCDGEVKMSGKYLVCTNSNCTGRIVNQILHGLEVFGLKGVGPALAHKAVTEFYITSIIDWMETFSSRDQVVVDQLKSKGFKDHEILVLTRCAETLVAGVTAEQLLMSLCIPKCGREFAHTVETQCGGIEHLPDTGVRDIIASKCNSDAVENFVNWWDLNREQFAFYTSMFKIIKPMELSTSVNGVVCFTGAGPKPRKQLMQTAIDLGYRPTENINEATILVCEDPAGSSSKLNKARSKGIKIVAYDEFFKSGS